MSDALTIFVVAAIAALIGWCFFSGIDTVDEAKIAALNAISPVVVLKGSAQYERMMEENVTATPTPTPTPTPIPTPPIETIPTAIATPKEKYVDPYQTGERYIGQWFKWRRFNVSGLKDMHVGVIVYRLAFLDSYTWYNAAMGQYYTETAGDGYRWAAVWVREEMFGNSDSEDPRMSYFDSRMFALQYKGQLIRNDTTHTLTARIKDFDYMYDYRNTVTAPPFGYIITYRRGNPATAGYVAEELAYLRMGESNGIDGYILFRIPKEAKISDLVMLGQFGSFGHAYWRFNHDGANFVDLGNGSPVTVSESQFDPSGINWNEIAVSDS